MLLPISVVSEHLPGEKSSWKGVPSEFCGYAYRSETITPNKRRWWVVDVPAE